MRSHACVCLSFSLDGVTWSSPVNLHDSYSAFRTASRGASGRLEFRSADHPAAGIVHAPQDPSTLHIYIHHSVKGTTMKRRRVPYATLREMIINKRADSRIDGTPHVRLYRLSDVELLNMTRRAHDELRSAGSTPA